MVRRLFLLLLLLLGVYVAREGYFFLLDWKALPVGTTIGEVEVGGLTLEEAGGKVAEAYGQPVSLVSNVAGERAEFRPSELGFELKLDEMLAEAERQKGERERYIQFLGYLIRNPVQPIAVELMAEHDVDTVAEMTSFAGGLMEDPALPPRLEPSSLRFLNGEGGYSADVDTASARVIEALYSLDGREVGLEMVDEEPPALDFVLLEEVIEEQLLIYGAVISSVYVQDLQTGEESNINGDLAMSGTSIMKIPIILETYRRSVDGNVPNFDQQKLINETAIQSGNYSANLLLDYVAGQNNAYLGSDILTESMGRLGLVNTFIVTPYEEPSRTGKTTLLTPANSSPEVASYEPDVSMQTTAAEMGRLLSYIYECSQGGGALLAAYAEELDSAECQSILDTLSLNVEGNLLRFGVPDNVPVAHKHGWAGNTHGDAGVLYTPNGDYVLVVFLAQPDSTWLIADYSFPVFHRLSRIVYNYFNADDPYLEDSEERTTRFLETLAEEEAEAEVEEAESEEEVPATDENG